MFLWIQSKGTIVNLILIAFNCSHSFQDDQVLFFSFIIFVNNVATCILKLMAVSQYTVVVTLMITPGVLPQ